MESVDRLRDWLKGRLLLGNGRNELNEIADAIESEVKADRVDAYTKGYDEGFASADDLAAQHEDAMAGHGWVRLPVDAEGVPIRIGERVQLVGNDPSTVSHMSLADDGWRVYVKYDGGIGTGSGEPKRIRHHHALTVEDVLREFVARTQMLGCVEDECALVAEYATKLRLAGDE